MRPTRPHQKYFPPLSTPPKNDHDDSNITTAIANAASSTTSKTYKHAFATLSELDEHRILTLVMATQPDPLIDWVVNELRDAGPEGESDDIFFFLSKHISDKRELSLYHLRCGQLFMHGLDAQVLCWLCSSDACSFFFAQNVKRRVTCAAA